MKIKTKSCKLAHRKILVIPRGFDKMNMFISYLKNSKDALKKLENTTIIRL